MGRGKTDGEGARDHTLRSVLSALRPYLPEIILIGGWVPYLHRQYGGIHDWNAELSFTSELDVLLTPRLPARDRPPLARLLGDAGLHPVRDDGTDSPIWTSKSARGETIEFLVPLQGPLPWRSLPVSIVGQSGIAALSLPDLGVLERHTRMLSVPATGSGGGSHNDVFNVRVPRLGAYAVNKAITFLKRRPRVGEVANPKRAKDLLYLRDLMAAGVTVVETIEADLDSMLTSDPAIQHAIDTASSHLEPVAFGAGSSDVDAVAVMLAEREPHYSPEESRQDIQGHLSDLYSIFERRRSPSQITGATADED